MSFGEQFVWGAATSSFQIEGGFDQDGRGASIWDEFTRLPNRVMRNHGGELACDHRNRYREDVKLMAQIGLKAYRFSIAWPRVMPDGTGSISEQGLDFYSDLVDALLEHGITPWVTLYHWDLPWSLHLRGGWLNPEISDAFEAYAEAVVKRLGDRVTHWMTINEPQVITCMGYADGSFAPGLKLSLKELCIVSKNLLLSHGKAVRVIRGIQGERAQVGWAPVGVLTQPLEVTQAHVDAARQATFDVRAPGDHSPAQLRQTFWNSAWWMDPVYRGTFPEVALQRFGNHIPRDFEQGLDIICQPADFFAANIYISEFAESDGNGGYRQVDPGPDTASNTMGWDICPDALYWGARFFHERYQLPIVVTENGIPQTDLLVDGKVSDPNRIAFMSAYLKGLKQASREGVPVHGYFYWSLMDNFEWSSGYKQRFGIVHVDYATQRRTLKQSAHWYGDVIRSNGAILG